MIKWPNIAELKRTITIDQVLAAYGVAAPKAAGKRRVCACPIHGAAQKSRAFSISADGCGWYCFKCKHGGSVIDLVMALEHCGVREAADRLAARFGADRF